MHPTRTVHWYRAPVTIHWYRGSFWAKTTCSRYTCSSFQAYLGRAPTLSKKREFFLYLKGADANAVACDINYWHIQWITSSHRWSSFILSFIRWCSKNGNQNILKNGGNRESARRGSIISACLINTLGSIHIWDLLVVNYCVNDSLNNGLYCTKWAHSHFQIGQLFCGVKFLGFQSTQ